MKEYTDEQLQENYERFLHGIEKAFKHDEDRLAKLLHMYSEDELGLSLAIAPASGNKAYHNAYPGGYIDHVMNVVKMSLQVKDLYESNGGKPNFETSEMVFAAFHHDLGKLGDSYEMHYVPNESQWHVEKLGKIYTENPKIAHMDITDRTFFLLQKYDVKITENEWFGISLADGMFREHNKYYLQTYNSDHFMKHRIAYILHWADIMATNIERDEWMG